MRVDVLRIRYDHRPDPRRVRPRVTRVLAVDATYDFEVRGDLVVNRRRRCRQVAAALLDLPRTLKQYGAEVVVRARTPRSGATAARYATSAPSKSFRTVCSR